MFGCLIGYIDMEELDTKNGNTHIHTVFGTLSNIVIVPAPLPNYTKKNANVHISI
jgi:hypothetical protein